MNPTDGGPAAPGASSPTPRHDPYAAFRHGNFRLFLACSIIDSIGGEMVAVVVGWDVYERTKSALALGLVGLVLAIPVVLLSLPAGQAADRWPRRTIMIVTQCVWVATSIGLTLISYLRGPIPLIYACVGIAGVANAFAFPARWSIMPQLVPPRDFNNAVTWRSSGWQVAAAIGPAVGGGLLYLSKTAWFEAQSFAPFGSLRGAGPALAYVVDVGLGLLTLGLLLLMRVESPPKPRERVTWASLVAGWAHVRRTELIWATITLDMFAVLLGGATALLPIFATSILSAGPAGFGWLRAAPSIGSFLTAITLAHAPPMKRAGRSLLVAVAGFGLATVVFGLSRNYWLSLAMLFLTGAFDNISVVVRSTLVQVLTPDALRGRVSAVNSIFIGLSNELGAFESGVAADLMGAVPAVVAGGLGSIAVVLGVLTRWPSVARLGSLADARPEGEPIATASDLPLATP